MDKKKELLVACMNKVHPNWLTIFKLYKRNFINILENVCDSIDVSPTIPLILEAFMLNPLDVKVVIIGQDPYPKIGDANGLCFSTNASACPASLKNVLKAIGYEDTSNREFFDFHNYVYQGVLLLNTSLTTGSGTLWKSFISNILTDMSSKSPHSITFMLWGNDAKHIKQCIKGNHSILEWTHPSPLSDNMLEDERKFKNCNHFTLTPNIDWKCLGEQHVIYTDGAVKMSEPCVSSYGVLFGSGVLRGVELSGIVNPFIYININGTIVPDTSTSCLCTAQRGEYLAMCYALQVCININLPSPIKIVSDSRNALLTMQEWYAKKKDKTKFGNYDLVVIMCTLFDRLNESKEIELMHINSHQKENGNEDIRNNNLVDGLAKRALTYSTLDIVCNSDMIKFI
jgi:uracil-DNA glycosylase